MSYFDLVVREVFSEEVTFEKETWVKWESKWCEDTRGNSLSRGNNEGWKRKTSSRCLRNSKEPGWLERSVSGEIGKAGLGRSCWMVKAKKKTSWIDGARICTYTYYTSKFVCIIVHHLHISHSVIQRWEVKTLVVQKYETKMY